MPSNSIIIRATGKARRTVLAALAGTSAVVMVSIAGGMIFQGEHRAATDRLVEAHRWADQILLADERLTMSANMAAATGEQRWITRYEANVPAIDEAIRKAGEIVDPGAAERLDAQTRLSNDRLVELERASFDAVRGGDLDKARRFLDGPLYQYHKEILSAGTREFADAALSAARAHFAAVQMKALVAISASIPLAVIGAVLLWRRLNASLEKSEGMFIEAEKKIEHLAMSDALTGLANRRSLREGLQKAILRARETKTKVAVLMIDLDRFKPVNDRHGHVIGDLVLKEVAERVAKVGRAGELRGRYGGDEFIAVIEYSGDDQTPRRVGQRLVESLSEPMIFKGLAVEIGASVGFAIYPTDGEDVDELVRKADAALYCAKGEGRGGVCAYTAAMERDIAARQELQEELRHAIRKGSISPFYQPLVELSTGRIAGFEVLSRWHHPAKGLVAPGEFIRLAEDGGLINELTMTVLQKACLDARSLPQDVFIAINVAPRQIQDEWLAQKVLAILTRTKFPPHRLEIELTEHALVHDIASARQVILSLKNLGIKVALDDFGTGYSSLSYLSELPFDRIKIDRSFIKTLHTRPESAKIVSSIVGLGSSLGVSTIAEGVETQRDVEALRRMGCTLAQGYYYSPPVPANELAELTTRSWSGEEACAVA